VVDFGGIPPEVNSALMYAGAGSTPLQAAASAWNSLAAELSSAAADYDTVVTRLASEEWLGSSSASMASAVQPYVQWMSNTSAQAETAATQARAAAAAYEQAFSATVPPPLIAANRAELTQALQTNVLGQNSNIIAQLEAQYSEFWAQDAATMYQYASQSAAASKVANFTSPTAITNPAGQALQASATAQSAASSAATSPVSIQQLITTLENYFTAITTPNAVTTGSSAITDPTGLFQLIFGTSTLPTSLTAFASDYSPIAGVLYNTEGLPYFSIGMANNFVQASKTLGLLGGAAPAAAAPAAAGGLGGLGAALGGGLGGVAGGAGGGASVAAGVGAGAPVGGLSVPPGWSAATAPATGATSGPLPVTSISGAPEGAGAGNLLGGMPLAGAPGFGGGGAGPRYGFKPTVMGRPPFAG
jgi:PPE-repeat protein